MPISETIARPGTVDTDETTDLDRQPGRNTITAHVTAPDGTVLSYTYKVAARDSKTEENRRSAEQEALDNWEQDVGRDEFWEAANADFLSGLSDYMPDYDQLLQRNGTDFSDIMGYGSQQTQALRQGADQFQGIYNQGGYTGLERGQIQQAQGQANRNEQAQRQALQQQMQMRGMGGSGMEMMGSLQAQQAGANQGLSASTDIATQAQQRALQALSQGTQMQAQAGQAADAFNQAHLGWQDQQQGLAMQAGQTGYENQVGQGERLQNQANNRATMMRQLYDDPLATGG